MWPGRISAGFVSKHHLQASAICIGMLASQGARGERLSSATVTTGLPNLGEVQTWVRRPATQARPAYRPVGAAHHPDENKPPCTYTNKNTPPSLSLSSGNNQDTPCSAELEPVPHLGGTRRLRVGQHPHQDAHQTPNPGGSEQVQERE